MDGTRLDLNAAQIIASNGRLHQQMIETVAATRPEAERRHVQMLREERTAARGDED
jgi:hypothetical protein